VAYAAFVSSDVAYYFNLASFLPRKLLFQIKKTWSLLGSSIGPLKSCISSVANRHV
jgi:hypothetical protein